MRIKVNHITQWAKERECQGSLPLLIKKLSLASSKKIRKCDFPSEDQVYLSGFDGIIENDDNTLFVPEGQSVWEMGCNNEWRPKANEDYRNRTKEPLGINQEITTYIQVSPQLIEREDIEKWEKSKIKQKIWKDVKLYGALELETWINETLSVERWFAEMIGFPNKGVETLERWWSKWCQLEEDLEISPDLVLTDKEEEVKKLSELMNNKKITVKSNNIEESIAFLYAAITKLPEKDLYLSKALVIHDEESMEHYSQLDNLILIPSFENYKYYEDGDNTVYVHTYSKNHNIELADSIKLHFIENLEKMGIAYADAKRYAKDSGRNLTILKRIFNPEIQPEWMNDKNIRILITLFFTQIYDENNKFDLKIIEEISGMDYETFLQSLLILSNERNSPIFKNINRCFLKSPKDTLFLIGKYITSYDFKKIEKIIYKIFKSDSMFNDEEYYKCTSKLKEGILKSLILISVFGEDMNVSLINSEKWVDEIFCNLFKDESHEFWDKNYYYFKLMAEVSPTTFLKTIKHLLDKNPDYILNHFDYLLSGLKILALNPFDFKEIIDIHLNLLDLKFNENMLKFLKELFVPWYMPTGISLKLKLTNLDYILNKNLTIGFEILKYLLSQESEFLVLNKEPHWRTFYEKDIIITKKELFEFNHLIRMKLLENMDFDMDKWSFALEHFRQCNDTEFEENLIDKLYEYLEFQPDNIELWNLLRENISRLNEFPEYNDSHKIVPLKDVYYKLTPKKLIQRYKYLFDDTWPAVLDCNFDQQGHEITCKQKDAVNYIYRLKKFEGIKELINSVEYPSIIGIYMYNKNIDDEVFDSINENDKMNNFASQYLFKKSVQYENWSDEIIQKILNESFDDDKVIFILTSLKPNCDIWRNVKLFKGNIQDNYWLNLKGYRHCQTSGEGKYYVKKLLRYSKHDEIIEFIGHNTDKLEATFIGDTLTNIDLDDEYFKSNEYRGKQLLKILNENNYDKEKLIKLEFRLSSSFRLGRIPYDLKTHEEMSKNPQLISKLIEIKKGDNSQSRSQCSTIIEKWAIIPGTGLDGNINYEFLQRWFNECLELIEEKDETYFYSILGRVLSKSSEDNGVWPRKEICRFIDEINNPKLNNSFKFSIEMKYATYSKSIYDGGRREKDIANKYCDYAEKIVDDYPVTARILFDVSKKFENDAKYEKFESDNIDYEYD